MTQSISKRIAAGEFNYDQPRPRIREFGVDREAFRAASNLHYANEYAARERFFEAIEQDAGMVGHPLSLRARRHAWQEGHSGGYEEVHNQWLIISENFLEPSEQAFRKAGLWGNLIPSE